MIDPAQLNSIWDILKVAPYYWDVSVFAIFLVIFSIAEYRFESRVQAATIALFGALLYAIFMWFYGLVRGETVIFAGIIYLLLVIWPTSKY